MREMLSEVTFMTPIFGYFRGTEHKNVVSHTEVGRTVCVCSETTFDVFSRKRFTLCDA